MRLSLWRFASACALLGASPALLSLASREGYLPRELDLPAARQAADDEDRREAEGLAQREAVLARFAAKRAVAEDLAAGRTSLAEAGERIRALNAGDSAFIRAERVRVCGAKSEEEAARWEAVTEVRLFLGQRSDCEEVAGRLEAELRP